MLKKSIITLALMFAVSGVQAADLKIGVVNIQQVFNMLTVKKQISDADKTRLQQLQDEIQALQKEGKEIQERANREKLTMTQAQTMEVNRRLMEIDNAIKLKGNFYKEDLNFAQQKQNKVNSQKILDAIKKVAQDENFDLVVRSESIFYSKEGMNIDGKVAAILNDPAG